MKLPRLFPLATAFSFAAAFSAHADVKLPALFSDHSVLQREQPIPIWGTADADEEVTVEFAGQKQTTKAGADGKWKVTLQPLKAAESLSLSVKGKNALTINDVAVGEVWIASGQSNMAFRLPRDANGTEAVKASTDKSLRFFTVPAKATDEPQTEVVSRWAVSDPTNSANFSAVGYYFARELRKALNVPVGIINSSVGGTVAEAWTSKSAIEAKPELDEAFKTTRAAAIKNYPAALERYQKNVEEIEKKWAENVEKAKAAGDPPPRKPIAPIDPMVDPNRPSSLFNGMIAPLQPYGIRGTIWYQGESNSGRGKQYQTLFPTMISDWRKGWGQGEFPFFFVQIAPHNGMSPEIREAQLLTSQTLPHTALAVTTDVGNPKDIHPTQKEPVGVRLALAARATVYGEKIEYSGPTFETLKVEDGKAVLKFQHAKGLAAKEGELKGFTVAGEDKKFVPAKAEIKGETVVVSAEAVAKPIAARYGWANVPDVNLINAAGLPASPFRTDVEK